MYLYTLESLMNILGFEVANIKKGNKKGVHIFEVKMKPFEAAIILLMLIQFGKTKEGLK